MSRAKPLRFLFSAYQITPSCILFPAAPILVRPTYHHRVRYGTEEEEEEDEDEEFIWNLKSTKQFLRRWDQHLLIGSEGRVIKSF